MTVIVGLVEDGRVYIGADAAASDGHTLHRVHHPKVFQTGPFLIGYTSSFRMGQLLQYGLDFPPQGDEGDMDYFVTRFVPAVVDCFKEAGYARVDSNFVQGGTFIVGYRGQLYRIDDDFQVLQFAQPYLAVGSGEEYAEAVMYACSHLEPEQRVRKAIETAAHFVTTVTLPATVMTLE